MKKKSIIQTLLAKIFYCIFCGMNCLVMIAYKKALAAITKIHFDNKIKKILLRILLTHNSPKYLELKLSLRKIERIFFLYNTKY